MDHKLNLQGREKKVYCVRVRVRVCVCVELKGLHT